MQAPLRPPKRGPVDRRLLVVLVASVMATLWFAAHPDTEVGGQAQDASLERRKAHLLPIRKDAQTISVAEFERRVSRNLSALEQRGAFSPLTGAGHRAWSGEPIAPAAGATVNTGSAPAALEAPAFPYHWVGRWTEAAGETQAVAERAVIAGEAHTWFAKPGDVIEGQWRIDSVEATALRVTYLPMAQSQTISISSP